MTTSTHAADWEAWSCLVRLVVTEARALAHVVRAGVECDVPVSWPCRRPARETNLPASPVGEAGRSVSQPDVRPKGLEPLTF